MTNWQEVERIREERQLIATDLENRAKEIEKLATHLDGYERYSILRAGVGLSQEATLLRAAAGELRAKAEILRQSTADLPKEDA